MKYLEISTETDKCLAVLADIALKSQGFAALNLVNQLIDLVQEKD